MNQQINRTVCAQESTIIQDESPDEPNLQESRFECPICINWLIEPVLTSCGHRFCKKCIMPWLKKPNSTCPIDNKPLSCERDIFPDNFTRREILQIRKPCPNLKFGCEIIMSPLEMESHLITCQFKKEYNNSCICLFHKNGCQFVGASQELLDDHIKTDYLVHLSLINDTLIQTKITNNDIKIFEANTNLWDAPSKESTSAASDSSNKTDENLLKNLYERIVFLEQTNREQNAKIGNLSQQISKLENSHKVEIDSRLSNGIIIWEITDFREKIMLMQEKSNQMYFSKEAFTSVYGYKFCARINISPKHKQFISLHVHLMRSENDFHLDWPFRGRIKMMLVNIRDINKSQYDTVMSTEILAFHRPLQTISPRGFGFVEYANISDLYQNDFVLNDTIIIKVQMNIV